jgi:hypothetical protein
VLTEVSANAAEIPVTASLVAIGLFTRAAEDNDFNF